jgi:hypothetical protein
MIEVAEQLWYLGSVMFLPEQVRILLAHFQSAFTNPTWQKLQVLFTGTLLGTSPLPVKTRPLRERIQSKYRTNTGECPRTIPDHTLPSLTSTNITHLDVVEFAC